MNDDQKPNPDELLKTVQEEEIAQKRGKLKIFFGMAAGVGKTYAMLEEAQQKLKEGVDLVIGVVNTHGRRETEELLQGLPQIPEKWVNYKESVFQEFDLEAMLARDPQLAIIDELAHSNVPGSKHAKRWQDVLELLDAGIDVFTSLNVQHIETRKDIVESITGVLIRETVPDLLLERATSIEFIDVPPVKLLQRLKEGKVYLGDQSTIAVQNFFKEDKLTALREIALRFTAEKVEHDFHQGKGWKTHAKLMAAISPSPASQQLIRTTRRLAFQLDAPWIVVYVETGKTLNLKDQERLNSHINLARDLGAEVIITHDVDVATALQRVVTQKDITSLIVGRPPQKKQGWWNFFEDTFIERLEKENKDINIVILRQDPVTSLYRKTMPLQISYSPKKEYLIAFASVFLMTALGYVLDPVIGYKSIGLLFLLSILSLSLFLGPVPIFFTALLSAMSWGILFIPPFYELKISDPTDIAFVGLFLCVSLIVGLLINRLRRKEQVLKLREEKIEHLYEIEKSIANAKDLASLRINLSEQLNTALPGQYDVLIKDEGGRLRMDSPLSILKNEKERSVAVWAFQKGKVAGSKTDTLPSSEGIYFPIIFPKAPIGILAYHPALTRPLSLAEINFLQTIGQQLGPFLERQLFEEHLYKQEYTGQTEKLHQAIFHALNHSFYASLDEILEINRELQTTQANTQKQFLFSKMKNVQEILKQTVNNIIAISALESGFVHLVKKMQPLQPVIEKSLEEMSIFTEKHPIILLFPDTALNFSFDFNWLKMALNNLIQNAAEYSPPTKAITIEAEATEQEIKLSVSDEGQGIPKEILPFIFDKFYRVPGTTTKGMGLGLAIVKRVVEIHQGTIEVKDKEGGGTTISLILPLT